MEKTEINSYLERIGNDIVRAFQEVIDKEDLIDTGLLRRSVEVKITENYEIIILTQDYYKYLEKKYNLDNQIINNPYYIRAEKTLEELGLKIIEDIEV